METMATKSSGNLKAIRAATRRQLEREIARLEGWLIRLYDLAAKQKTKQGKAR